MQQRVSFKIVITVLTVFVMALAPQMSTAQRGESSNMMFSPYTMYGIGDLVPQGTASQMAMGGVGVSLRQRFEINYLNPASLSEIPQRSALFSFGLRADNYYATSAYAKSAYSNFDLADIGIAVPLARGVGFAASLRPVSAVGYSTSVLGNTPDINENVGKVLYEYHGDGGISQLSAALGVRVVRGFSLGVNYHYYFGNSDRYYDAIIFPLMGQASDYRSILTSSKNYLSTSVFSFGAQYAFRVGKRSEVSIGATFQPRISTKFDGKELTMSANSTISDTISFERYDKPLIIPQKIAAGISFEIKDKFIIAFDYSTQNWTGAFDVPAADKITLRSQESYRFGLSYTPDRYSIKSAFKRWTYKFGAYYTTSYLMKDGVPLNDVGFTLGVDFPLKRNSLSKMTVGMNLGTRGSTKIGQVKENYLKFSIGISMFGDDRWFVKSKLN